ncbi:MAG: hypothetical protein ACK5ZC_17495 [Pirellulaceae bacterium]|jgi:hypothetical protein
MLAPPSQSLEESIHRFGCTNIGLLDPYTQTTKDLCSGRLRPAHEQSDEMAWLREPEPDAYEETGCRLTKEPINQPPWQRPWWPILRTRFGVVAVEHLGEIDWNQPTAAIFSSYRSRTDPFAYGWMIRLRQAIESIGRRRATLLVPTSSPVLQYQCELAQRCGVAVCLVEVHCRRPRRAIQPSSESSERKLLVTIGDRFDFPSIDSLMAILVDSMEVIHCMPKGQTERALQLRTKTLPELRDTIHRWDRQAAPASQFATGLHRSIRTSGSFEARHATAPIFPLPEKPHRAPGASDWLVHCTRANPGQWPQQNLGEHIDEILCQDRWEIPSPLETLIRILQDRRLLATGYLKRSGSRSISFSAKPLRDLLDSRCYQRHLQRWDWEPYGIALTKRHLLQLGARPVRYGIDADAEVQARWQMEEEWRLDRDLSLTDLPWGSGFVFVPDLNTATQIATTSPLPVGYLHRAHVTFRLGN